MAGFLIVDGYNILHAWDEFKGLIEPDLAHARARLVDMLGEYRALKGIQVIVVFDAHLVKGGAGSREEVHGVEVIYSAEGETADMVIERLAGRLGGNFNVTVATSDWAEQRLVFSQGAVRMSARELREELTVCKEEARGCLAALRGYDGKVRGYLDDDIRESLEKIRRQK